MVGVADINEVVGVGNGKLSSRLIRVGEMFYCEILLALRRLSFSSFPSRVLHDPQFLGASKVRSLYICLAMIDYFRKWISVRSGLITVAACVVICAAASQ